MYNYVRIEKKSLFFNYYAYIDTEEFLADTIFIQEKLKVFFGKTGRKQDSHYTIVLCKIWKKDAERFVYSMEILHKKMLLLGHKECSNFFAALDEE